MPDAFPSDDRTAGSPVFATTHWSVVVSARSVDTRQARAALEQLAHHYWFPLYAYVRRRGYSSHDAEDLTQEFFARLLARDWVARADQAKGRFRTFLLTAMERFLANEYDRNRALKRGGGVPPLPLKFDTAETRYGLEPADARTPEQIFEHRWAMTLLDEVMRQLEAEFDAAGKASHFTQLKPCLCGDRDALPYQELAERLELTEGAVKSAVHRLRQRYRALLRAEIANTVLSSDDVEAELRHLFRVLADR